MTPRSHTPSLAAAAAAFVCVALSPCRARAAEERPAPKVIGFDDAVAMALARNPSVQIAAEEIRRAEAVASEVGSASLPSVSAGAAYTRLDANRVLAGSIVAGIDQVSGNVLVQAPLVSAKTWVQWSHARDNVDVSRLSAVEARRQLAVTVAHTYLSLVAQHRVMEVAERAEVTARAHFDFAHQRYTSGYGTRIDEVRAAEEVASDGVLLENDRVQLARLREALSVLLGVGYAVDVESEVVLPSLPAYDQALGEAASQRSDVLLGKLKLTAATHLRRDDWTDYMPTLVATFQPFFQYPPTPTIPETGWQAQLALAVPLYDGGLRYAQARERLSLEKEARLGVDSSLLSAGSDVRVADEEVRRSVAALAAAVEAARLSGEELSLSNLAYQSGASTNIEVIDAQRRARDAESAQAVAEDAQRQGALDLLIASGRFPLRK